MILDHIAIAREAGLPYVYLGYWVPGSPKMDYKARYKPLEIFSEGRWIEHGAADLGRLGRSGGERVAIGEQVSAIELPVTK